MHPQHPRATRRRPTWRRRAGRRATVVVHLEGESAFSVTLCTSYGWSVGSHPAADHFLRGSLMPSRALMKSNSAQSIVFDGAFQLTVVVPSSILNMLLAQSLSSAPCVVTVFSWSVHNTGPVGSFIFLMS